MSRAPGLCRSCGGPKRGRQARVASPIGECQFCFEQICERHSFWYEIGYVCLKCARDQAIPKPPCWAALLRKGVMPSDDSASAWFGPVYFSHYLLTAPTLFSIDWESIPVGDDITPAENQAEWFNICARATSRVDGYINQVLRATVDVELFHGPDYHVNVGPAAGGSSPSPYWGNYGFNTRLTASRWPVLEVTKVQTCPNNVWPRTWTALPTGYAEPEKPPIGIYGSIAPGGSADGGQGIIVAPGYVNWSLGRNGWAILVTYLNGYPHCSLTSAVAAGATSLPVNDTTGWAISNYYGTYTGATGVIKDSGWQEAVHVTTASTTSGPET